MKRRLSFLAAAAVLAASVSASAACNIKIAGIPINLPCGTASYNNNGTTMVPLRSICEALGAQVGWNGETNTATATCGDKTVSFDLNGKKLYTENGTVQLSTPACNKNGTAYIPLRSLCEALGCKVNWNSGNISIEPDSTDCGEGCTGENSEVTEPEKPQTMPSENTGSSVGNYQKQVLELVNQQRANYGLSKLSYSTELEAVAYRHSKDMADNNYFNHTNLQGKSPFDRMRDAGISYRAAAENIAAGQKTPEEVVNAWMNSSGHRANILNPSVTEMGLGIYFGGSYGVYWKQLFIG